ncbi:hypothetical protein [Engelhardtia mirabilis]|uniref:hypothetical protein n=1 Tax=Engelhardtia mirabilis TaxID=2528011 RepID=UPI0011A06CCA
MLLALITLCAVAVIWALRSQFAESPAAFRTADPGHAELADELARGAPLPDPIDGVDRREARQAPAKAEATGLMAAEVQLRSSHDLPIDLAMWWPGTTDDREAGRWIAGPGIRRAAGPPSAGSRFVVSERPSCQEAVGHLPVQVGVGDRDLEATVDQLLECISAGARYRVVGCHHNLPAPLREVVERELCSA